MIETIKVAGSSSTLVSHSSPLSYISHVIQTDIEWLMGHGVYSFEINRERSLNGRCLIQVKAISPVNTLVFSSATKLSSLFENDYIPKTLSVEWDGSTSKDVDGISKLHHYSGETVMNNFDLRGDVLLAEFAYGLADVITGFFVLGCTRAKYQCSQTKCQHWFNFGMKDEELNDFLKTDWCYNPEQTVGSLPTVFDPKNNK